MTTQGLGMDCEENWEARAFVRYAYVCIFDCEAPIRKHFIYSHGHRLGL